MRKFDASKEPEMHQNATEYTPDGILVPSHQLAIGGRFIGQIRRNGQIIDEFDVHNLVVDEGLNKLLNVMFNADTQVTTWYLSLFEGNYTPVAGITAATIVAAATECTAYANATRPDYVEVTSTAKSITNAASRASFVFTAAKTIYGAFLTSVNTKSSTSGVLFAAARFSSAKSVEIGDELLLTYAFSAAST